MNKSKKIYFPNLNGLRFIAALLVIVHHIEQFKSLLGIENGFLQYFISIIVTILISGFSYEYYESYFIKKKLKYSKILSGDNAK